MESIPKENKFDIIAGLKTEQRSYKTLFSSKFLNDLTLLLEQCFLPSKNKKEHFVTKEKLSLSFLKLLQSQKKFKTAENLTEQLGSLALLDTETNLCGRILNIDMLNRKVEFFTLYHLREKLPSTIKGFDEVHFFDPRTLQMEKSYNLQKTRYDCFCYLDTFSFLTGKIEDIHNFKCPEKTATHFSTVLPSLSKVKVDRRYLETDIKDR